MHPLAEQVKSAINMPQLLAGYGFQFGQRSKSMCCPFHREKTASFTIYEDHFHCFGCGAHGDIIRFVREYFNLTFSQAILKICSDFGINADLKQSRLPRGEAEKIRKQREQEKFEKDKRNKEYFDKAAEFRQVQRDLIDYCPKNEFDFVHERYIQALHKFEYLKYWLEENLSERE